MRLQDLGTVQALEQLVPGAKIKTAAQSLSFFNTVTSGLTRHEANGGWYLHAGGKVALFCQCAGPGHTTHSLPHFREITPKTISMVLPYHKPIKGLHDQMVPAVPDDEHVIRVLVWWHLEKKKDKKSSAIHKNTHRKTQRVDLGYYYPLKKDTRWANGKSFAVITLKQSKKMSG